MGQGSGFRQSEDLPEHERSEFLEESGVLASGIVQGSGSFIYSCHYPIDNYLSVDLTHRLGAFLCSDFLPRVAPGATKLPRRWRLKSSPARAATHVFRVDSWQSLDRSTHHEGVSQIA